ncbi:MAG: iron ABC transporter permease [candidate division NC10 bacterium]|nr:iron ABC transporter permease [candidate division NC10 bacterium]MBI2116814.1 iron ABC transporter permease [candidate division NC10 bacterium]MBI2458449.1 iron ABC transporter permease [candidate division NC10 bacterium]MBI2562526.1 iron ABC transporter permease [candidate division NC10 bacterium]MBI3122691.1 iron ABC transporter permease [candidate division NC10 bacterium]
MTEHAVQRRDVGLLVWLLAGGLTVALVAGPLVALILSSLSGPKGMTLARYVAAFAPAIHRGPILNSFVLAASVGGLSVALGLPIAWALARTSMPLRGLVRALVVAAFVTPSFLGAMAWIILAGPNAGLLNMAFRALTGAQAPLVNIFSMGGLIFVVTLSAVPIVVIMAVGALQALTPDMEEAARIAGAGPLAVARTITLPLIAPAILGAFLLAVLEALVLFGAPAMIAIPARFHVMTTQLWAFFQYPPRIEVAAAYALPLMVVAAGLLWIQRRLLGRRGYATTTGREGRARPMDRGPWDWAFLGLCLLYVTCAILLPYGALLMAALSKAWGQSFTPANWTLANFHFVLFEYDPTRSAIVNTLELSAVTATAGALLTALLAYAAGRRLVRGAGALAALASVPLAIPGIVLAVGLFIVYTRPPLALYGTVWILFVAYLTKYLPVAYTANRAAVFGVHPSLEEAARTLGGTRWAAFRDVALPLMRPGLASAWLLVFLPALRELSSAILLFTANSRVVSVVIYELYEEGRWEAVSTLGVLLLALTLAILAATHRLLGRRLGLT